MVVVNITTGPFGTNRIPTVFEPGPKPQHNHYFLLFMAATVRAVHLHSDLLRIAIAGPSNDHRLGANEAPPAIVSIYLGDDIHSCVENFIAGSSEQKEIQTLIDLGLPSLPIVRRQQTDRNRTSTFAFTGNKFEFRAVGSSQNPSRSNVVLNTILAESIQHLATELEKLLKSGKGKDEAIIEVARKTFVKHWDIVFNGNGYSEEWQKEAARRGLPNLRTTPQALKELDNPKTIKLFNDMKVLTVDELKARKIVFEEDYAKKLLIEAKTLRTIAATQLIPASSRYAVELATTLAHLKESKNGGRTLSTLTSTIDQAYGGLHELDNVIDQAGHQHGDSASAADYAEKQLFPALGHLREHLDKLETLVAADRWPIPTYHQMLFHSDNS